MSKEQTQELRSLIIQYFKCLSSGQNVVQCIKQTMFLQQQFNPLLLFDMIAQGKQVQTQRDWRQYFQKINLRFSQEEFKYFFSHYLLGYEIKFNQFMEVVMPFNQDVLRIYKKNYYTSIELDRIQHQIEVIFAQLCKFWIKFFGNLIQIKKEINRVADMISIQGLIKHDLVFENKVRGNIRQSVKFKQKFEEVKHPIGYNQLRVFLQLWVSYKNHHVQFDILQIRRHLGTQSPLQGICSRQRKSSPIKKKSQSVQKIHKVKNVSFTNLKQKNNNDEQNYTSSGNRYVDFKNQLLQSLQQEKPADNRWQDQGYGAVSERFQNDERPENDINRRLSAAYGQPSGIKMQKRKQTAKKGEKQQHHKQSQNRQEHMRNLRYARDQTGINGSHAFFLFAQINAKEQVLQKMRKNLANRSDFNLINLHKLIDHNNKGYITAKDLQAYCNVKRDGNFNHLIQNYAREKGKLRFQDFCMIFRPLSKKLNQVLDSRPENNLPNPFKKQTINTISQILTLSSLMFTNLRQIKQRINNSGIKPSSLFRYVDITNKGYIEASDISDLLEQKGVACDEKNLKCVMKIFGKRVDEKIGVKEFQKFVDL